ncbi:MAG: carboxylate--amine ligase [Chloroflexota bacterium]|nr:MAG: carboxylate--amine ligase [Chloroflexota bacterium]
MGLVEEALEKGQRALSEYDSKRLLASYGIPITPEILTTSSDEAVKAAEELGYPVVLKGTHWELTHKTELGLVLMKLRKPDEVTEGYRTIVERAGQRPLDGVLVQQMVSGSREFVIGLTRDVQFGPCVMFGLGGIFTEALKDITFRVAPIDRAEAREMLTEIRSEALLGPFRGEPETDLEVLSDALVAIGNIGMENDGVKEIDVNPLIIAGGKPVAVDALVILA